MTKLPLPLTQLVYENLSIVMTFAFSRGPLERLVGANTEGEWKYLEKFVLDTSEERATKACIELAVYLRAFDDETQISTWLRENSERAFGKVILKNGSTEDLRFREVANKIIHASSFKWDFSTTDQPLLICTPRKQIGTHRKNKEWRKTLIDIVEVAAFCGEFMS